MADVIYSIENMHKMCYNIKLSKQFYAEWAKAGYISMVLLVSTLVSDIIVETTKFIFLLVLLAVGVVIGGGLRKRSDAKKAAKKAAEEAAAEAAE